MIVFSRVYIRCLLWLGCFLLLNGQVVAAPDFGKMLKSIAQVEGDEDGQSKKVAMPDPRTLGMGWTAFLEGTSSQLKERRKRLIVELNETIATLPEEEKTLALTSLRRLDTGLAALAEARARESAAVPKPDPFKKEYTIDELIQVYESLLIARQRLKQEKDQVEQMRGSIEIAERYQDDLMVNYAKLESRSAERIVKGLEIMANRTAILVNRERLRLQQALLKNAEVFVQHTREEFTVAQERLIANGTQHAAIEQRIKEGEAAVLTAQGRLYREEAQLLETLPDTPLEQARASIEQQQLLLEKTREAIAQVQLVHLQAVQVLSQALHLRDQPEEFESSIEIAAKQQLLDELDSYNKIWSERSRIEYNRAQEGFIKTDDASESDELDAYYTRRLAVAKDTLTASQDLQREILKADLLLDLIQDQLYVQEPEFIRWVFTAWDYFSSFLIGLFQWSESTLFRIDDEPVTPLELVTALCILGLSWLLSKGVRVGLRRMGRRQKRIAQATFYTLGRLAHYSILTIGVLLALASVGIRMTSLLLVAGALSVGIGFGLQDIVNNFLSGLIILFERIFRVGDYLELEDGTRGSVSQINVRSTVLRTNDGLEVVIPNSDLVSNKVTNWTMQDTFRRLHIEFGVAYGADKEVVKQAALEAAERVPFTLRNVPGYRAPEVWLVEFGDSSLNFHLVVWVNALAARRPQNTVSSYLWEIHSALAEHGVEIPFPQRDLYIKKWPQEALKMDK